MLVVDAADGGVAPEEDGCTHDGGSGGGGAFQPVGACQDHPAHDSGLFCRLVSSSLICASMALISAVLTRIERSARTSFTSACFAKYASSNSFFRLSSLPQHTWQFSVREGT